TKIDINNLAASFDFLAPDHMIHLLYTPKIDVYTLAFVLNKLLTGQTPLERSAKIKGIMSMYLAIDAIRPFIKGEEPLTFIQDETFAEPEKLNSMLRDATCHYLEDRLTLDEFHARMNEAIEAEIHSRKKFVRNWTVPT
ncbi:hypothetical protein KY329_00985, partial [Candidatus Woesearchaeota archaeon]|nr:hypothetical protein [Candidatus Woesearchaeota archaeon]